MELSIIIPVYNVAAFLPKCVDSLLVQTFSDYEIILVDDGATDDSPRLCDSYARLHPNVRVIHKPNGGSADARNAGKAAAQGDYIIYVDSDDFINDPAGLQKIHTLIRESGSDVVIFGCKDLYVQSGITTISRAYPDASELNRLGKSALVDRLIETNRFPGAAWLLCVRRSLLSDHGISFVKGNTAEDFDWLIRTLLHAGKVQMLDAPLYTYRKNNSNSITSRPRVSGIKGILTAIENWNTVDEPKQRSITQYLSQVYLQALLNYAGLGKEEKRTVKRDLLAEKRILKSHPYGQLMVYPAFNLLGIDLFSMILRKCHDYLKR